MATKKDEGVVDLASWKTSWKGKIEPVEKDLQELVDKREKEAKDLVSDIVDVLGFEAVFETLRKEDGKAMKALVTARYGGLVADAEEGGGTERPRRGPTKPKVDHIYKCYAKLLEEKKATEKRMLGMAESELKADAKSLDKGLLGPMNKTWTKLSKEEQESFRTGFYRKWVEAQAAS